jgi:glycosyltransferase involved in cell wall biosynthesis
MTISIITPTYNTPPDVLARTFASLKAQTHTDWEWIIWDDSTTGDVWQQVWGFCSDERYIIRPYRAMTHNGSIGSVKRNGFMVATGDILVELDHDDELMPDALAAIQREFGADPDVGFVYSEWCEILPNGESGVYLDGWAFGYGRNRWDEQHGCWALSVPEINRTTLSHIVSVPNHVRAWRATVYRWLNGHDPKLGVADDYELILRTALNTECRFIPEMLYRQHIGAGTAQRVRNAEIQTAVQRIHGESSDHLDAIFGTLEGIRDE